VQAKLLRAVETGEVRRLGASRTTGPGCRVVAATNRDLGSAVGAGLFRLDLVERLACLVVRLPPLRCRPEDLAPLARRLCGRMPERPEPDAATLDALAAYDWPGNVRELRNVLRRAAVLSPGGRLDAGAVRESIAAGRLVRQEPAFPVAMGCAEPPPPPGWGRPSRAKAIAESGMPRSTYYYRLKRGRIPGVF
jgi:DNA-binding NtrC family response regulator